MTVLLIGIGLLAGVMVVFYLKNRVKSPMLARFAHSELLMRFTVIAVAMIAIGLVLALDKLLS